VIATDPSQTAEGMLAKASAEHCSILATNHIRQVVKKAFADSKAAYNLVTWNKMY